MTDQMTSLECRHPLKYNPLKALVLLSTYQHTMISQKLFQRSFYTTTARALQLHTKAHRFVSPLAAVSTLQPRRYVASSVGSRPASQNLKHAALNIREEVGNSAADAARSIAGGNLATDYVPPEKNSSFVSRQTCSLPVSPVERTRLIMIQISQIGVTKTVAGAVPAPYLVFGLAGALPYLGTSGTVIYLANQASLAAQGALSNIDPGVALTLLDRALSIQVTYGAVMLSFLGALHWGMEFSGLGGYHGYRRLILGAAPIILAWPTLAMGPTTALMVQWLGFTGLWYADVKATAAGWGKIAPQPFVARTMLTFRINQPRNGTLNIASTSPSSLAHA